MTCILSGKKQLRLKSFFFWERSKRVRKSRHINLGEISAALQAELQQGKTHPDSFYLRFAGLSSLSCCPSGGQIFFSSSQCSDPAVHSWFNSFQQQSFLWICQITFDNPADDPTRDVLIRSPVRTEASWFTALKHWSRASTRNWGPLWRNGIWRLLSLLLSWARSVPSLLLFVTQRLVPQPVSRGSCLSCALAPVSGGLSAAALELLRVFPEDKFVWHKKVASLEEAFKSGAGVLDLFSGSRGFARACAELAETWVLTFDMGHNVNEDLLSAPLQSKITKRLRLKAFRAMGAAPVCCSFSTAITPPCRSSLHPGGVPWCSEKQQLKNKLGNEMLRFVLSLIPICLPLNVLLFVEIPDGSWMWRQQGSLGWDAVLETGKIGDLRLDYCRFGTKWRKRTRFRTNSHLRGQKVFCQCDVRLRGKCKKTGVNFTKMAEPNPRQVCFALASGLLRDAGFFGRCGKVDVSACAKVTNARVGEAANPGPRRSVPVRRPEDLARAELLEPATIAVRHRLRNWMDSRVQKAQIQISAVRFSWDPLSLFRLDVEFSFPGCC